MTLQQLTDAPQTVPLSLHEEVSSEVIETSRYDFADVMRLLDEYTQKYQRTVDAALSPKDLMFHAAVPLMAILYVVATTYLATSKNPWVLGLSILSMTIFFGSVFFSIATVNKIYLRRESVKTTDTKTFLQVRLENLVRLVSQMHESGRLTPSQKLEADLRLAEAELVLKLGDAVR